jgi:uncharacterized RDD family membrane protein YckC
VTATEGRPTAYPWRQLAPAAPAPRDADVLGRPAGLVSRGIASVLDAVVVILLVTVGWAVVAAARFLIHPARFTLPSPGAEALLFLGLGTLAAYLAVTWAVAGGSYGDRLLGLRVRDARGTRLDWPRCALRALLCTVFPLGLFWVPLSRDNRSVQDLLLRTSVVHDGPPLR